MEIFTSFDEVNFNKKTAVALGNFEGIHIGHRLILENTVAEAAGQGLLAVCFTFSNHPRDFISCSGPENEHRLKFICTQAEKMRLLEEIGFDAVVNVPFDENIMDMSPEMFISDILAKKLHAETVCCGFNYRFGRMAAGDGALLEKEGSRFGIKVRIYDPVTMNGETISSTAVRRMIRDGEMEKAAAYLGRLFSLGGRVVRGKSLGRRIGFPTVNFRTPKMLELPPNGVYITETSWAGSIYPSITNIGTKPTVGGKTRSVETNIFDFNKDIYGEDIRVFFIRRLRPEIKFDSVEELKKQIGHDSAEAREYHSDHHAHFCGGY